MMMEGKDTHNRQPTCTVCMHEAATVYCVNDDAYLCGVCDATHHEGPLAAKHERRDVKGMLEACGSEALGCSAGSMEDVAVVPQYAQDTMFNDIFGDNGDFDIDINFDLYPMSATEKVTDMSDDPFSLDKDVDCVVPSLYPNPAADYGNVPDDGALIFNTGNEERDATVPMVNMDEIAPSMVPPRMETFTDAGVSKYSNPAMLEYEEEEEEEDDYEDPNDTDFYVAPRRSHATRRTRRAAAATVVATTALADEPEMTREERVARYRAKRARRTFQKTIRYQSRKAYAEIRPRIKGRFVSHEEYAEYMASKERRSEAVVPAC